MLRPIEMLLAVFLTLSPGLSDAWVSPGTGQLYTMDTSFPKPLTDITRATSAVLWETSNNCYVVMDTLIISYWKLPDTLIVAPGTVVKFEPGFSAKIEVEGVFSAQGTETDTIVFTSNAVVPDTNDWKEIRFRPTSIDSLCVVSYCLVEYGRLGIICNQASPTISHNRIVNTGSYGIVFDGSPMVCYNLVENSGGRGIGCGGASRAVVAGNVVRNNYWRNIRCTDSASPLIVGNEISGSPHIGIRCADLSSPTIIGNTIVDNGWGIVVEDSASPLIGGSLSDANDIYGSDFAELDNSTPNRIMAEYNYWGSVDRDSIESKMRNWGSGSIDYVPWTNASHDTVYSDPPVANAGGPYCGEEGSWMSFDGSNSSDDGRIVLYEWDIDGDGDYDSVGVDVSHTWGDDYVGVIVLRVTDDGALSDTDTTMVTVQNVLPSADAGGPYRGGIDQAIQLSGSATDPGMDSIVFEWDLDGDGEYDDATGQGPTHIWSVSGVYTIYLRVTDDDGGIGADSAPVTISLCGDCNGDGRLTVADATYLVAFIYRGGPTPLGQGDVNLDGRMTVADATYIVAHLYRGGPPPCEPAAGSSPHSDGQKRVAVPASKPGE